MSATSCKNAIDFAGKATLVGMLDEAVQQGDDQTVTAALRDAMCRLIRNRDVCLPECVKAPVDGHYARRELYRSPRHGYSVVAMTWAPAQGTPVHDHAGLWCVEGVWQGELEIVQYQLLEHQGELFRFRRSADMHACLGSAGCLIPPHEYHTIRNPSADAIAISLHVYKGPMDCCNRFHPQQGEWFVRERAELATDAAN